MLLPAAAGRCCAAAAVLLLLSVLSVLSVLCVLFVRSVRGTSIRPPTWWSDDPLGQANTATDIADGEWLEGPGLAMGGIWPSSYEELLTNNIHIMHQCSWIHTHATAKKPMQCARLLGHIRNRNIKCTYIITHTCGITHCCLSSPILTGRYVHNHTMGPAMLEKRACGMRLFLDAPR